MFECLKRLFSKSSKDVAPLVAEIKDAVEDVKERTEFTAHEVAEFLQDVGEDIVADLVIAKENVVESLHDLVEFYADGAPVPPKKTPKKKPSSKKVPAKKVVKSIKSVKKPAKKAVRKKK